MSSGELSPVIAMDELLALLSRETKITELRSLAVPHRSAAEHSQVHLFSVSRSKP